MKALTSIVVGIDFSECSRVALIHALRIANRSGAALHIAHVVATNTMGPLDDESSLGPLQRDIQDGLDAAARQRWESFSTTNVEAVDIPIEVRPGSRVASIRELVVEHKAELLVLGAVGNSKPNVGLGTIASGCIRSVPADVLVVRDNFRTRFETVAVGIDFSNASRDALESAGLIAQHDGATLHAVHVAPDSIDTYARLRRQLGPELRSFVTAVTDRLPGLAVQCHVHPASRHRSALLEFASLINADLIVVGAKGRTNLHDVILGTTAEKVLRDSAVAVLVAKTAS